METSNYQGMRRISFLFGVLILSLLFSDCTCEGCKDVPKVKRNDPIKAPAAFAFIDANVVSNTYVPNVTVTLVDPNEQVRTSSGTSFTELMLKNGVMNLGLHYQAAVNEKEPYRYRIKAEAPGYVTTMETVLLTDEEPGYYPVFMVKLEVPPSGVSAAGSVLAVNNNGYVTSDIDVETPLPSSENSKFTISIPAGTQLLSNCKGVSVPSGETAKIQLASFDPTAPDIGRTFPNGFLVTDAINENGEVIASPSDPLLFASAGWISANIQVGDQEVDSFSKPVEGTMTIDAELINPKTQEKFQVGDTIPIWSLDEAIGNWRLEEEAIVQEDSGELFVKFAMSHLSTWNLDFKADKCPGDIEFFVHNTSGDEDYFVEIEAPKPYMLTGVRGSSSGVGFFPTSGDGRSKHTINRAPQDIPLQLKIFDTSNPMTRTLLAQSQIIENCNDPAIDTIELTGIPEMCVNLEVTVNNSNVCNNAIWYKTCSDEEIDDCIDSITPWSYAGVLNDGKLTTLKIPNYDDDSETYLLFQVWYEEGNSIKFLLNQNPFVVAQACRAFTGVFDIVETIEPPMGVTVVLEKTCSRPKPGITPELCPNPMNCGNCLESDEEVTVKISISGVSGATPTCM